MDCPPCLGGVALLAVAVVLLWESPPLQVSYAVAVVAVSTFFTYVSLAFVSMFNAFEKMHFVLLTTLIERTFTVSVAILLLIMGYRLEAVVMVVFLGSILNLAVSYLITLKFITKPSWRFSIQSSKEQLVRAVPYAATVILLTSMYSLNTVLTGMMLDSNASVAYFGVGFNMVIALVAIPTVMLNALLPVISRIYRRSTDLTRLTQQKVMKYMFALGIPITVGGLLLADQIIVMFYQEGFLPASDVFRILMPVVAISFFGTGIGSVLASANMMKLNTVATGIGAAMNFALCLLLIPLLQEEGAAVAFSIAYLTITVSGLYFLSSRIFKVDYRDILLRPLIAALGMGMVLFYIPDANLFLAVALGAATYFILLFVLGTLDHEDRKILTKLLGRET